MNKFKDLKKSALCSDLHIGRRSNSEEHNIDCLNFIKWFCEIIKKDKEIDHIIFLGDWHEQRSSIGGSSIHYSYECAKLLNTLELPVFFISGNHDLFYRNTREISTTLFFESLENFIMVDKEIQIIEGKYGKFLVAPFLFDHEYKNLLEYSDVPIYYMHAEFQGFVVTGDTKTLEHGPDHKLFKNQKRIFSGHFHKRQNKDNVFYIGNTFPMNFSDANDIERGCATYDYATDTLKYFNWQDCPSYIKCNLSDLIEEPKKYLRKNAFVRCLVDIDLSLEESSILKDNLIKKYNLRELSFEEKVPELQSDDDIDLSAFELESTENLIKEMLKHVESDKIESEILIKRFEEL